MEKLKFFTSNKNFYKFLHNSCVNIRFFAGIYTLKHLKTYGRNNGLCPYFLARHAILEADVIVFNYQYIIDPKISGIVSKEFDKDCVIVFDEAHNIDNIAIESLTVTIQQETLKNAFKNINSLKKVEHYIFLFLVLFYMSGLQTLVLKSIHQNLL